MGDVAEKWLPIPGLSGYEASSLGNLRGADVPIWVRGDGRVCTRINGESYLVYRLVALAFLPNPNGFPVVRHLNDDPTDNRVENLAWGTQGQNMEDAVRNGVHPNVRKTHCPEGHEYTEDNIYYHNSRGSVARRCRICHNREAKLRYNARRDAKLNPQERQALANKDGAA